MQVPAWMLATCPREGALVDRMTQDPVFMEQLAESLNDRYGD